MTTKTAGHEMGHSARQTIGTAQAIWVSLGFNVGTIFVIIAREVTEKAGNGSFLTVPASYLLMLLPVLTAFLFNRRFPGMRFGQYSQVILGPIAGKGLAILIAIVSVISAAAVLRRDVSLVAEALMPETPLWFFMALQTFLAYYALSRGFEVFARVCQTLFLVVAASLIFLVLAALPFIDMENFMPAFGDGLGPIIQGGFPVMGFSVQYMLVAGVLVAHMRNPGKALRVGLIGWLGAGLLLSLVVVAVQGIFGAAQTVKLANPPLELAKIIQIGGLARGVEAVLVAAWMLAGLFQGALFYYLAAATLNDAFDKPGYQIWLIILYAVIPALAYPVKNAQLLAIYSRAIRYWIIIPAVLGSYILLVAVAWMRGLFRRSHRSQWEGED